MQKTKTWAIGLVIISTLFTTIANSSWKIATLNNNILYLLFGFIMYGTTTLFLIIALKNGELSVLFPINTTSFIWVTLVSSSYFNETISLLKWFGVAFILVGVTLVGGSKE